MEDRKHQSDPEDVRTAALRHPNTQIIMAHLTGAGMRGVQAIEGLQNLVIDTSGMQPESGIIEYAVKRLGAERVVFGSDIFGRDLSVQIGQVLGACITDKDKGQIFYDNAAGLLGIDPANIIPGGAG